LNDFEAFTINALSSDGSVVLSSIKPSQPYEHLLTFPVRVNDNQELAEAEE